MTILTCPQCGTACDYECDRPSSGDPAVCVYCSALNIVGLSDTGAIALRVPDAVEWSRLHARRDVQHTLDHVAHLRWHGHIPLPWVP